jgi:hypothetical protein
MAFYREDSVRLARLFVYLAFVSVLLFVLTSTAVASCSSPSNAIEAENCKVGNPASQWDIHSRGGVEHDHGELRRDRELQHQLGFGDPGRALRPLQVVQRNSCTFKVAGLSIEVEIPACDWDMHYN